MDDIDNKDKDSGEQHEIRQQVVKECSADPEKLNQEGDDDYLEDNVISKNVFKYHQTRLHLSQSIYIPLMAINVIYLALTSTVCDT